MTRQAVPISTPAQAQRSASSLPTGKRDTSSVLLELLEWVPDADKLNVLLEPANLLRLLLVYGWKEQDIKQQLMGGKIPGELLLDLLKLEPNPDVLLGRLGRAKGK